MNMIIQGFVDRLTQSSTLEELMQAMSKSIQILDYEFFAYINFDSPGYKGKPPWILANYPRAWFKRYNEQGYAEIDPVLKEASRKVFPFPWNTQIRPEHSKKQNRLNEEAQAYEIHHGITIPILKSKANIAVLTMTSRDGDGHSNNLTEKKIEILHLLALYFHATFLGQNRNQIEKLKSLSFSAYDNRFLDDDVDVIVRLPSH